MDNFNDVVFSFDGGVTAGVSWVSDSSSDLLDSVDNVVEVSGLDQGEGSLDSGLQSWGWAGTWEGIGDLLQYSGWKSEPSDEVLEVIECALNCDGLRGLVDDSDLSAEGWGEDQCNQKGSHLF